MNRTRFRLIVGIIFINAILASKIATQASQPWGFILSTLMWASVFGLCEHLYFVKSK